MPDQPVERQGPDPYPLSVELRVSRLEDTMSGVLAAIGRLEAGFTRLEAAFVRLEATFTATLPHLATKAEIARLPTKAYMWAVLAVLITAMYGAFGAGLAAIAILR